MTCWTLIPQHSLVAAPWRNGLGTSHDIVARPGPEGGLGWTVSIADLDHDAPFSHYPFGDRVFTPIAGDPPPALAFDGGPFEPCPLLVPRRFSGETPTLSQMASPSRAFNSIVDRRYFSAAVTVLQLAPGDPVEVPAARHVVLHCLSGCIAAVGELLGPGDSLVGVGPATPGAAAEPTVALLVTINPT